MSMLWIVSQLTGRSLRLIARLGRSLGVSSSTASSWTLRLCKIGMVMSYLVRSRRHWIGAAAGVSSHVDRKGHGKEDPDASPTCTCSSEPEEIGLHLDCQGDRRSPREEDDASGLREGGDIVARREIGSQQQGSQGSNGTRWEGVNHHTNR